MCAGMIDLKKAMTKIMELEEELKSTRDGYEEEIATLVEKNDDLKKKLKVFMGFPTTEGEDEVSLVQRTTSSLTTPSRIQMIVTMIMLMKLEQISWSLHRSNFSSRPP